MKRIAFTIIMLVFISLIGMLLTRNPMLAMNESPPGVYPKRLIIPGYPPLARQGAIAGDVVTTVRIAQDGSVSSVEEIHGSPFLAGHIEPAVRQFLFFNLTDNPLSMTLTFRFSLEGEEIQENILTTVRMESPQLFVITTNPPVKPGPDVEYVH